MVKNNYSLLVLALSVAFSVFAEAPSCVQQPILPAGHLGSKGESTLLMVTAARGNMGKVRELIAQRACLDTREGRTGNTALLYALSNGQEQVALELINAGADVTIANNYGLTPSLLADEKNLASAAQAIKDQLQRKGIAEPTETWISADPEKIKAGQAEPITALMRAAVKGDTNLIDKLLAKGASLDTQGPVSGNTALLYALSQGKSDVARKLIEAGARTDVTNKHGIKALDLARAQDFDDIAAVLQAKEQPEVTQQMPEQVEQIIEEQVQQEPIETKKAMTKEEQITQLEAIVNRTLDALTVRGEKLSDQVKHAAYNVILEQIDRQLEASPEAAIGSAWLATVTENAIGQVLRESSIFPEKPTESIAPETTSASEWFKELVKQSVAEGLIKKPQPGIEEPAKIQKPEESKEPEEGTLPTKEEQLVSLALATRHVLNSLALSDQAKQRAYENIISVITQKLSTEGVTIDSAWLAGTIEAIIKQVLQEIPQPVETTEPAPTKPTVIQPVTTPEEWFMYLIEQSQEDAEKAKRRPRPVIGSEGIEKLKEDIGAGVAVPVLETEGNGSQPALIAPTETTTPLGRRGRVGEISEKDKQAILEQLAKGVSGG